MFLGIVLKGSRDGCKGWGGGGGGYGLEKLLKVYQTICEHSRFFQRQCLHFHSMLAFAGEEMYGRGP